MGLISPLNVAEFTIKVTWPRVSLWEGLEFNIELV